MNISIYPLNIKRQSISVLLYEKGDPPFKGNNLSISLIPMFNVDITL